MIALLALIPGRAWLYAGIVVAVVAAGIIVRQHYINAGWDSALESVKKQDGTAREAASKAQMDVDRCYDAGGVWSTITGSCTVGAK